MSLNMQNGAKPEKWYRYCSNTYEPISDNDIYYSENEEDTEGTDPDDTEEEEKSDNNTTSTNQPQQPRRSCRLTSKSKPTTWIHEAPANRTNTNAQAPWPKGHHLV